MSKRFGRNQRRRMRAELAQANAVLASEIEAKKLAQYGQRKAAEKLAYLEDSMRRLGEFTAFKPATTVHGDRNLWRMDAHRGKAIAPMELWPAHAPSIDQSFQVVNLHELASEIDVRSEQFDTLIHFFLRSQHGTESRWGYRVSMGVLKRGMPPDARQEFAIRIARELLEKVDHDLKKGARR